MLRTEQRGEAQDAELKTCHLKENEKEKTVMCSYVALSPHKEQSTSHIFILFFFESEQTATQHNETTYPNCTRQNENGTK